MAAHNLPSFVHASAVWADEDFAAITKEALLLSHADLVAAFSRLPMTVLQRIVRESKYAAFRIARPSAVADQHEIAVKRINDEKCASAKATFLAMAGPKFACFGDRLQVSMKIMQVMTGPARKFVEACLKIFLGDDIVADVAWECTEFFNNKAPDKHFTKFETNFPCDFDKPTPRE